MNAAIIELDAGQIDQVDGGARVLIPIYATYVGLKEFVGVVKDAYNGAKAVGEWVATH